MLAQGVADPKPRREVVPTRGAETARHPRISWKHQPGRRARIHRRLLARDQRLDLVELLIERHLHVPARAVVEGKIRAHSPTVLHEQRAIVVAHVERLRVSLLVAAGRTDEEVGEVQPRLRAEEGKQSVRLHIGRRVHLVVQQLPAQLDGMRADHPRKGIRVLERIVVLVQPGDRRADDEVVEDHILHALDRRPLGKNAGRAAAGHKPLRRQCGSHPAHRRSQDVDIAQVRGLQLVDRARTECPGVAQADQLGPALGRGIEPRHRRASLLRGIRIVQRVIVNRVVAGDLPPSGFRIDADRALVVAQRLVLGGGGELAVRQVGSGYVLQQVLRRSRPRGLRNHRTGKHAGISPCALASGVVIGLSLVDRVAKLLRKLAREVCPAHRRGHGNLRAVCAGRRTTRIWFSRCERSSLVGEVAGQVLRRRHGDQSAVHTLGQPRALIVAEEEEFVSHHRAGKCPAKLVLDKRAAVRREKVAGIQIRIAKEFEYVTVILVGAGLGNHADLSAARVAILRIHVAGQNAELGDRIQVWDHGRAHGERLLHLGAVHRESIGELALSIDRKRAGIQISRRRNNTGARRGKRPRGKRGCRRNSWLQRQQVGKAAPVQRNSGRLRTLNYLAKLRIDALHADVGRRHGNGLGLCSHQERGVYQ